MQNTTGKRTRNLYEPLSKEPYKISRSKLEMFVQCPRCFYLDRRLGIGRPPIPSFTLNNAVDTLLKKEFDIHRAKNKAHPLMKAYKIKAVPFQHAKLNEWRHNFTGIRVMHEKTNFLVFGAVDDLWISKKNELIVVDYKSTSTSNEITLDGEYKEAYKRQMEIYQWLARHNDDLKSYKVNDTGYFVYVNGKTDREAFDGRLEFDVQILPYQANDDWVETAIIEAHDCLMAEEIPEWNDNCEYCRYLESAGKETHQL